MPRSVSPAQTFHIPDDALRPASAERPEERLSATSSPRLAASRALRDWERGANVRRSASFRGVGAGQRAACKIPNLRGLEDANVSVGKGILERNNTSCRGLGEYEPGLIT